MRILAWALILLGGLFAPWLASRMPAVVEALYARTLYPLLAAILGRVGGLTRASLAQATLLILTAAVLILAWRWIRAGLRLLPGRRQRSGQAEALPGEASPALATARTGGSRVQRVLLPALVVPAIVVWTFFLLWGLNHARPPLDRRLGLARVEMSPERLAHVTRLVAAEVNHTYRVAQEAGQIRPVPDGSDPPEDLARRSLRDRGSFEVPASALPAGEDPARPLPAGEAPARTLPSGGAASGTTAPAPPGGRSVFTSDPRAIADRLDAAYRALMPAYRRIELSSPKSPALLSWLMTRVGLSGFYFPFSGEATVNGEMPDAAIPLTMAHEMAHQRGIAPEDEANFMGYLACRESGLAVARYSAALRAYSWCATALWQASPDSFRALPRDLLEEGPRADRAAIRAFWQRHRNPVHSASDRVNDAYLKSYGQTAGTASYDLAIELLVAYEAAGGLSP